MPRLNRGYPGKRFDAETIRSAYEVFKSSLSGEVPERRVATIGSDSGLERLDDARRFFEIYDTAAESAELSVEYASSTFHFSSDDRGRKIDIFLREQAELDAIVRVLNGPGATGSIGVFLGHGRSGVWQRLRGHLERQAEFTIYTYEGSALAGVTAIELLTELSRQVDFAVLVHTQDRIFGDQDLSPSDNVVHETGFFQGALGRHATLVVRELGCASFANIGGIHELAFAPDAIETTFDGVVRLIRRARGRPD